MPQTAIYGHTRPGKGSGFRNHAPCRQPGGVLARTPYMAYMVYVGAVSEAMSYVRGNKAAVSETTVHVGGVRQRIF